MKKGTSIHTANPKTYTLTAKLPSNSDVLWKAAFTKGIPGAKMDDARGERNVIADTRNRMKSLLL